MNNRPRTFCIRFTPRGSLAPWLTLQPALVTYTSEQSRDWAMEEFAGGGLGFRPGEWTAERVETGKKRRGNIKSRA